MGWTVDQHHHCLIFQLNLKSSSGPTYSATFENLSFLVVISVALTGQPIDTIYVEFIPTCRKSYRISCRKYQSEVVVSFGD